MPLDALLAVITHNVGGRFVESVKNAWWSMSPPECERALSDVTDQYYKPYILAVGDSARCLFMMSL